MKVKIFHSRRIADLEQAINEFLDTHEVSVLHTHFTSNLMEDSIQYWQEHTLLMFYYPRIDEGDPFQEEEVLVTRQGDNPFEEDEVAPDDTPQPPY